MWNRYTSAVHHANSVRTLKNTFPRLVMRLLLCVDAELDNICTSWNTFVWPYIVYLSHLFVPKELKKLCFCEGRIQIHVAVWVAIVNFILTLCFRFQFVWVFYIKNKSVNKIAQSRLQRLIEWVYWHTRSNVAICSLQFLSSYGKNGHHCNTTPLCPSFLSQSSSPELSVLSKPKLDH